MTSYATVTDVITFRGAISADAASRLPEIIKACSSELRLVARNQGKDLDDMVDEDEDIAEAVKKGVVDASIYYYNSTESKDPIMTQFTQAAGGYSFSGTLTNPGGAFFFPRKLLRDLGLASQIVGTIEVFDI